MKDWYPILNLFVKLTRRVERKPLLLPAMCFTELAMAIYYILQWQNHQNYWKAWGYISLLCLNVKKILNGLVVPKIFSYPLSYPVFVFLNLQNFNRFPTSLSLFPWSPNNPFNYVTGDVWLHPSFLLTKWWWSSPSYYLVISGISMANSIK